VSAGAIEAGVQSLRTAVWLADRSDAGSLRVTARLVLAEALIHSLRGTDEEGLATLHEADRIALANHDPDAIAQARAELGYVDFLRAHYDRAEFWLTTAIDLASGAPSITAKATTYLGSVESDRANYGRAVTLLEQATALSRSTDAATDHLHTAIALAEHDHWLAFLPWPQALMGAVQIARADPAGAADTLQQAFARACQLGDPCWEGVSTRGLALVAEASGDSDRAFDLLADARTRCNRLANPYVWLDVHILDAQCELGRRYRHPDTPGWVETMRRLASRTGMKELIVRSMLHGAALGHDGDADAAALLGADIDNPQLGSLLDAASTRFALTSPLDLAPRT
jgi:tetratricopeptide (TPR) repeat protein